MDIHKPKAAHSWREFVIEIGTIICGILIALGLEQGIEFLHTRHEAHEIEHALNAALSVNMRIPAERLVVRVCLEQRIGQLRDELVHAKGSWKGNPQTFAGRSSSAATPLVQEVVHSPVRVAYFGAWQGSLASKGFLSLPLDARSAYGVAFEQMGSLKAALDRERELGSSLTALSFDLALTPELRAQYLDRLGALAREEALIVTTSKSLQSQAHKMGALPDTNFMSRIIAEQHRFRGECTQDVEF